MAQIPLYELTPAEIGGLSAGILQGLGDATMMLLETHNMPRRLELQVGQDSSHDIPTAYHTFLAQTTVRKGIYRISSTLEELPPQSPRVFNRAEYYYAPGEPVEPDDIAQLGRIFRGVPYSWRPQKALLIPRNVARGVEYALRGLISGASLLSGDVWITDPRD
jgi:hypothetical protein